jgi:hypothetical protein
VRRQGEDAVHAKSAAPVASALAARHWTFDRAALGGLTLFVAPPGYLLSEGLFEALQRQGRPVIWVRLGPRGPRPRDLPALAGRGRPAPPSRVRLRPAVRPGRRPPGLAGRRARPPPGRRPGPALLGALLEPLLEQDRACIVTSDEPLPAGALPARGAVVTADDLRLGPGAAGELLGREAPRLPAAAARRVASLCQGAAATLVAVCGATAILGPAVVAQAADRASGVEDLLADLASGWLAGAGDEGRRALALALAVGYSHPALSAAVLGRADAPPGRAVAAAAGRRLGHPPDRLARPAPGRPGPGPPPGGRDRPPGGRLPGRPGRRRTRRPPLPGA